MNFVHAMRQCRLSIAYMTPISIVPSRILTILNLYNGNDASKNIIMEECPKHISAFLVGWGVYDALADCLANNQIVASQGGVDPTTYPIPETPRPECSGQRNPRIQDKECPHMQEGLSKWEDEWTWGGAVPNPGAWVTIPEYKRVLVTSCSVSPDDTFAAIVIPESSEVQRRTENTGEGSFVRVFPIIICPFCLNNRISNALVHTILIVCMF